jgi:hypothetical protein
MAEINYFSTKAAVCSDTSATLPIDEKLILVALSVEGGLWIIGL